MASVKLLNVSKTYDGKEFAVKDVSLEIYDKEFVVLVGPSGCGKTTLLRMVAGLEEITEGKIIIGEKVINDIPPKSRNIAMVFQNYALYPHMTVYNNMAFGLKLRKIPKNEIEKRVNEAADILGLKDLLNRKPKELSGGQKQRVAVGRAIVRNSEVFLFDEPLSNLDAKLRMQMRAEILKLHQKLKITTIYVTHDQTEAMTMGDRIVVLNNGKINQYGAPLDIYKNPVNKFVAGFIGSPPMNFILGKLNLKDGAKFISSDETVKISLPHFNLEESYDGKKIWMGIRPEHFRLASGSEKTLFEEFEITIDLLEPMGNESYIHFKLAGNNCIIRLQLHDNVKTGDKIKVYLIKEHLHLFDYTNEQKIQ
jgi:multiple sugar transport system ATP-binding protein